MQNTLDCCCSLQFCREHEKALEVLREAHEFNKENSNVVLAIVDQMLLFDPPRISEAVTALKEGIHTAPQPGTQLLFAHRLFHFMSECGQDPGRCVCVCVAGRIQ
ncbi:hypothetical protein E2C01_090446 [Portunus trituberculatus]|uniref:Uncharacterized protein n=1 Tax=Portunus trituberculatus TaxID=210409 RepID=A0A5B7JSG9_PORTR|nr:hypothetical protein [Portunus trituberculatus]